MSAEVSEAPAAAEVAAAAAPKSTGRSRKKALLIGLLVLFVVAIQAVLTYLLLPSGHATAEADNHEAEAAAAESTHGASEGGDSHGAKPAHDAHGAHGTSVADDGETAEVPIGDFGSSNGTASPGSIMHVDFKLSALTSSNQAGSLEAQLKSRNARVRQVVNRVVRSSNLEELNDPNLTTIKRQIREEINRLLRKSLIIEVLITDVRVMEQ